VGGEFNEWGANLMSGGANLKISHLIIIF